MSQTLVRRGRVGRPSVGSWRYYVTAIGDINVPLSYILTHVYGSARAVGVPHYACWWAEPVSTGSVIHAEWLEFLA